MVPVRDDAARKGRSPTPALDRERFRRCMKRAGRLVFTGTGRRSPTHAEAGRSWLQRVESAKSMKMSLWLYVPSLVSVSLAVGLWLAGECLFGAGALLAAVLSFLTSMRLSRQILRADTQKRHLDRQLIQSQKLASIGELSAGIAHEINNPLAIIGQEVEWIKELVKAGSGNAAESMNEIRDSLQEISRQILRCGDITHKLLDFARKKEPLVQATEINRLIDDMARLVEKDAGNKDIRLVREFADDLPPVYTDPPLIRQVILNLLNNAIQAIGEHGRISIVTGSHPDGSVDVVVKDTGCGIHKEHLNKIFDPFFTTKPTGKGTGLGLSICHGIIGNLGGSISVESEVGVGSSFTVHLPAKSDEEEP